MNLDESRPLPLHTPRIMGLETEYMLTPTYIPMSTEGLCNSAQINLGIPHIGQFLGNGGRLYLDRFQPEYAGPECLTGQSVAMASRAGDLIIAAALEPAMKESGVLGKNNSGLFKRTLDDNGNSVGSHENYYIRAPGLEVIAEYLVPHLISRTIFTGTGFVDKKGKYSLDERMQVMSNTPLASGSLENRPFVLSRYRPYSGDGQRLQVMSGSANMLDMPTQFKFDSTSLVIRMIEHGLVASDFAVDRPGNAGRRIASQRFGDNFIFDETIVISGKRMTAPQIQMYYASIAKVMADSGTLNDYDTRFAHQWYEMAVDAVDGKIDKWERSIDWMAKLALIERRSLADGGITTEKSQQIDINYHKLPVGKARTLFELIKEHKIVDQLYTEKEIHDTIYQSPDVTRARARGQFIIDHCDNRIVNRISPDVTWTEWTYQMTSLGAAERRTVKIEHLSPYSRMNPLT